LDPGEDGCCAALKSLISLVDLVEPGQRDLKLFLQILLGFQQPSKAIYWLKDVADAFKDRSKHSMKTQCLLSEALKRQGDEFWNHQMLIFARWIHKNCRHRGQNILLTAYKGLDKTQFHNMYCADIVKGLKEDKVAWIKVLEDFMSSDKPPRSRIVYDSFYGILKRFLEEIKTTTQSENYSFLLSVTNVFCRVLLIRRQASTEDWNILTQYECLPNFKRLVDEVSELFCDEPTINKLATYFISDSPPDSYTYLAVVRLLETSINSVELSSQILHYINSLTVYRQRQRAESHGFWYLINKLVETGSSAEIHYNLMLFISRILDGRLIDLDDIHFDFGGLTDALTSIVWASLCNDDKYHKICKYVTDRVLILLESSKSFPADNYYLMICFLTLNPGYQLKRRNFDEFGEAGILKMIHRQNPDLIDVEKLKSTLPRVLDSSRSEPKISDLKRSLVMIDMIREFQNEIYFKEFLGSISWGSELRKEGRVVQFQAHYFLECESEKTKNTLKQTLSRTYHQEISDSYFTAKKVRKENLQNSMKIFFNGVLDKWVVRFTASLYFRREATTDPYCITVLVQLAK
jgi:hypothetical protein